MFLRKDFLTLIVVVAPMLICCAFSSCVSTKSSVYFHDLPDTVMAPVAGNFEPVIQKNDILQITVSSMNVEDAVIYNTPSMANIGGASSSGPQAVGFLVSEQGFIQYPVLGQVKADGLTKSELTKYLHDQLEQRKLLVDPVVSIRFLNYRVTVLGEVTRPTVVNVGNEKITIMEALGLAGDITVFGKKENVLLIRDTDGVRTVKRLNLNSREIFSSPYYYLRSNDIVYVEPNKAKIAGSDRAKQTIPIILSSLSLMVIILDRLILN
ncbi:polysaccharide export outer membrane protein [Chitinophaga sp. CF118]|nr:polysaccharide export outer membrane protein [Chitinophaga sp. CF118]